jgi:hypothetical protein
MNNELNDTIEGITGIKEKKINPEDVISSHNIFPNMKVFEKKDLDEWCEKHVKLKENKEEKKEGDK